MKDIPSQRGAALLRRWIAEGEHSRQDFKFMISDARKIARSISAFANREGGRLLIGVKDNGSIAGVRNEEDIYVVEQAAQIYCSPAQDVEFTAYSVDATTHVICASIARAQQRPVEVLEADGIRRAYYRIADENITAHPLMVRAWRRRSENDSPLLFSLSESEAELLDLLDSNPEGMRPRDIALEIHRSSAETDNLIVNLASIGIVDFRHAGSEFLIVRTSDESESD